MKNIILSNVFPGHEWKIVQPFGKTLFALDNPTYYPPGGHTGIDLVRRPYSLTAGSPIRAAHDGIVTQDGDADRTAWGFYVVIVDPVQLISTHYYHMQRNITSWRQEVKAGEVIGYVGSSGLSTGDHLHFGLCRVDKNWMRINRDNECKGFINPLGDNVEWLPINI